jgi:hypothetical protein
MLHTDVNYMHFVHFLLKLKQVHNLKNRVFSHIISDYMENPRPTFFCKFIRKFYDIDTLCVKNLYTSINRFLIRTRVKYPETLIGNNFKIPSSIFFKFGTVL